MNKYYRNKQPDIFEMIIEIMAAMMLLIGKLIFKLFRMMFSKHSKTKLSLLQKGIYPTNPAPVIESKYTLRHSLLTEAETAFLKVLEPIVGNAYHIESQVQLSGIVKPIDSNEHYTNYRDFNLIKAKSIDFVLYDKEYKPYLAIELDDSSHLKWDRIKRDQIVNEIMKDVGLRIIHVRASYTYDVEELRKIVFINP